MVLALALLLMAAACSAQNCDSLRAMQQRTYGFHPSQLTQEQQDVRTTEIDDFWNAVKQAGPQGIACLKDLLLSQKADSFFSFDGASLLFSLDHSTPSAQAAADALAHARLADVDPVGYIGFAMVLARAGADISAPARNYLHAPRVDDAMGRLKVDRSTGAIFLYGSMASADIDRSLVPELASPQPYARNTAALILALNMTAPSLQALRRWPGRALLPPQEREEATKVLHYQPVKAETAKLTRQQVLDRLRKLPAAEPLSPADAKDWEASAIATLAADDLEEIREARRRSMRLNDEAIYDYFGLTKILMGVINRLDLYSQWRIHPAAKPAGGAAHKSK